MSFICLFRTRNIPRLLLSLSLGIFSWLLLCLSLVFLFSYFMWDFNSRRLWKAASRMMDLETLPWELCIIFRNYILRESLFRNLFLFHFCINLAQRPSFLYKYLLCLTKGNKDKKPFTSWSGPSEQRWVKGLWTRSPFPLPWFTNKKTSNERNQNGEPQESLRRNVKTAILRVVSQRPRAVYYHFYLPMLRRLLSILGIGAAFSPLLHSLLLVFTWLCPHF